MIKMNLGNDMVNCPPEWEHFIDSIAMRDEGGDVPVDVINAELKKFNARILEHDVYRWRPVVEFGSEHDYLLFLLTYIARKEVKA